MTPPSGAQVSAILAFIMAAPLIVLVRWVTVTFITAPLPENETEMDREKDGVAGTQEEEEHPGVVSWLWGDESVLQKMRRKKDEKKSMKKQVSVSHSDEDGSSLGRRWQ